MRGTTSERKSKYLHEAGVLKDRFPLVPIYFAWGTAEFGAPDSREQCLLGGRIFVWTVAFVCFRGFTYWSNLNGSMPYMPCGLTDWELLKFYVFSLLGVIVPLYTMSLMWSGSFLEAPHNALIFCVMANYALFTLFTLCALFFVSAGVESCLIYGVRDVGVIFCKGVHTMLVLEYAFEIMYITSRHSIFEWFCRRNDPHRRKWRYVGIALFVSTLVSIILWFPGLPDNKCSVNRGAFNQSNKSEEETNRQFRFYLWFISACYGASFVLILYSCKQMMKLVTTQQNNVRALACKLIPITFIIAVPAELQTYIDYWSPPNYGSGQLVYDVLNQVRNMYGIFSAIYIICINEPLKERFVACCCSRCFPRREVVSEEKDSAATNLYIELQDDG